MKYLIAQNCITNVLIILVTAIGIQACSNERSDKIRQQELENLAANGNVSAQLVVGEYYRREKDYSKAEEWLKKSSAQGNGDATFELANIYRIDLGGPNNEAIARELLIKGAAQGSESAQRSLDDWNAEINKTTELPADPVAVFNSMGDPYGQGAAYKALRDNCSGGRSGHACAEAGKQLEVAHDAMVQHINRTQRQNYDRDQQTVHDEQLRQQVRQQYAR